MLFVHCIIQLEHLAARKLIWKRAKNAVKIINEIQKRPLNSRLKTLCEVEVWIHSMNIFSIQK